MLSVSLCVPLCFGSECVVYSHVFTSMLFEPMWVLLFPLLFWRFSLTCLASRHISCICPFPSTVVVWPVLVFAFVSVSLLHVIVLVFPCVLVWLLSCGVCLRLVYKLRIFFFFFSSGLLCSFSLFVWFCSVPAFTPLEPLCFCVLKSHWAVPALPACGICTSKTSVSSCTWDKPSMTRYTHQRLHERGDHLRVVCLCVRYITYYLRKNEAA